MSAIDVVDRIQKLEESGRLLGITDDRGKYIHLKQEELESVKKFILNRGRVSRADLLLECNKLVRLAPRQEDLDKIKQDEKQLLDKAEQEFQKQEESEKNKK